MAETSGPSFEDIKGELCRRIERLVRELAPGGRINGGYYIPCNPTRDDRHPGSFFIRISPPAIGAWEDKATGDKGDLFKLIAYCKGLGKDMKATRAWCLGWLGWAGGIDHKKLEVARKADKYVRAQESRMAATELARKRTKAKGWWLHGQKELAGTPVEKYLAFRGIALSRLAHPPGAIRFVPDAEHHDEVGEITNWPCMISAMCDNKGQIVAIHRTWLAKDGKGKAPVTPSKKIWPHGYNGAVIRLAKGEGLLSPEDAARKGTSGPLVITEGIEDGLSIALACPEYRVWAAGTLGNIANVPVELPCVSRVVVFADNDAGAQARQQLDKAIAALKLKRSVTVARASMGKDANDLLRSMT